MARARVNTVGPTHVLITGAAGAIGAAIARAMRRAWPTVRLALVDRDATAMAALAHELGDATTHGCDLSQLAELPALVAAIAADHPLDGLVNCAGIMRVQQVATSSWAAAEELLAVDLLAPLRLQDLIVHQLLDDEPDEPAAPGLRGLIVNVASMAGKVPLKGCAYYGAAKAGLGMASEIARAELAPRGVRVVTVYPGPVRSDLEQGARDAYGGGGAFGRFAPTGDPDELAARILTAIARDEPRVIYPRLYEVGWSANQLAGWFALSYGPPPVA